ncbi:hypothetical protein [Paracoccus siganidrum]|uniref:Uncharacterized protein n=1 Tax=Paracoccus siganidrum TaxID=1276757 RepID=A0A419A5Q6_9RHOB|nr:hypothetical protein [Paracoccus siganidrum]RJL11884.1 hypothetical protein D3P05_12815 [Paracoccus siganidrum]RMC33958.1 hypothetical protein C9E82_12340 [Paracoccus siganidrum]
MIDVAVFAVPAVLALLAAWSGWVRVAARSFGWLLGALAVFGLGAIVCWVISEGKTVGYLAGIVGIIMMILMGVGAAGMVVGALLRWGYELFQRHVAGRPVTRHASFAKPWDVIAFAIVAGIAVMLSAIE